MILTENAMFLKRLFPELWDKVALYGQSLEADAGALEIATSNSHMPTLAVRDEQGSVYIHSKYNPEEEARRFVAQLQGVSEGKHVFFYGVGLGYHVEAFAKQYPDVPFSLYEPRPEVFYRYVSHRSLKPLAGTLLKHWFVEWEREDIAAHLTYFTDRIVTEVSLIPLPAYERVFVEDFKRFSGQFRESVIQRRFNVATDKRFEKLWTMNSMANFPYTLNTSDMLLDMAPYFKGKPMAIVAAGPSLQDEIENLRRIKEQGSAYLFSVGSAINALLAHGIYPDAACTYDPMPHNHVVFHQVEEMNIDSIPLLFGTSVGYETLRRYPGPKFHMITSQDTLSRYFLRKDGQFDCVQDALTVAMVTLQLASKMGCHPIILVGQNLAYRGEQFYARGIEYEGRSGQVGERDLKNVYHVEDVHGNQIRTNLGFQYMRTGMERLIQSLNCEVVNTTKGGAKIKGTAFVELDQVMESRLKPGAVDSEWHTRAGSGFDKAYLAKKSDEMKSAFDAAKDAFRMIERRLRKLEDAARLKQSANIGKMLPKFDRDVKRLTDNLFFKTVLLPMNRIEFDILNHSIEMIREEKDLIKKANRVIQQIGKLLESCKKDLERMTEGYLRMNEAIDQYVGRHAETGR